MAKSSDMSLKLLIDTKSQRVLYGEADKNFIDFLFDLLSLPLGTVMKLIKNNPSAATATATATAGSLGNIYKSVESMSDTYWQPNQNKDAILNPKKLVSNNICSGSTNKLLPKIESSSSSTSAAAFYLCSKDCIYHYISDGPNAICPGCNKCMTLKATYLRPPPFIGSGSSGDGVQNKEGGFVKGVVTYMVMDDLTVNPMSTISTIALLNKFNIKDVGALQEKVVTCTAYQGVKLLEASLHSQTVLTDVFLERIHTTQETSPILKKPRHSNHPYFLRSHSQQEAHPMQMASNYGYNYPSQPRYGHFSMQASSNYNTANNWHPNSGATNHLPNNLGNLTMPFNCGGGGSS